MGKEVSEENLKIEEKIEKKLKKEEQVKEIGKIDCDMAEISEERGMFEETIEAEYIEELFCVIL
jgi:hypothetical protein